MRILLTIHCPLNADAGAAGCVIQLAEQYQGAGHEVHILSFEDFSPTVPSRFRPMLFPWLVLRRVRKMAGNLDVVDASSGDTCLCRPRRGRRRAAGPRPLFVTHSHGLEHLAHAQLVQDARAGRLDLTWKYPLYNGGFRLWEVARSFRQADLSLFLNEHELDYAVTSLGLPRQRARTIANGLAPEFLDLPFEDTPVERDAGIGIAQIGTYIQRKGIEYGSPALNAVMKEHPNVRVRFLGTLWRRSMCFGISTRPSAPE